MQTDSSASRTYLASRSASECTITVLIPNSRHARWMRSAISPRLAIRIFSNSWLGFLAGTRGGFGVGDGRDAPAWGRRRGTRRRVPRQSMITSGWPNSTGWPFSARICLTTPALSDSISFISFIASMMHSGSPTCTLSPTSTNALLPGEAAR